jgi:hypothetical protein
MLWARMLAYVTGMVNQELLLRNEYLAAENRILKGQIKGRLLLSEAEKATLAEIAHRLWRKALEEVAGAAQPDTILGWYRKLIANKFDGSRFRRRVGRPRIVPIAAKSRTLETLPPKKLSSMLQNLTANSSTPSSLGGCYIDTLNPFPEGTLIRCGSRQCRQMDQPLMQMGLKMAEARKGYARSSR